MTFFGIRLALRSLLKRPGFLIAAVTVLALGIGANTAIFSLVNSLLLKPLAIQNPGQVVGVYSRDTKKPDTYRAFSYPNFADMRASLPVAMTPLRVTSPWFSLCCQACRVECG